MSTNENFAWLTDKPIAHRGLHDAEKGVFENSLSAFRAAIKHDYAIECDLHLSADGVPFVFHDDTLTRMTGREGRVRDLKAAELSKIPLKDGGDTIPRFSELLSLVAGRVPLVVELKGTDPDSDRDFADALAPLLAAYEGQLALMSFSEWLVEALGPFRDRFPIGLTAEGTRPDHLDRHRRIVERSCSFVSYNVHHLPNAFVNWVREERQLPVISWTIRTPGDAAQSVRHADQMTFEGFLPQV